MKTAGFPPSFSKSCSNYCTYDQRSYKDLDDIPLFGYEYPCMYQVLRRNTPKLYFYDNMPVDKKYYSMQYNRKYLVENAR